MGILMTFLVLKDIIWQNLIYGCVVLPKRINLNDLKKGSL